MGQPSTEPGQNPVEPDQQAPDQAPAEPLTGDPVEQEEQLDA